MRNFQNNPNNKDFLQQLNDLTQSEKELQQLEQKRSSLDPEKRRQLQVGLAERQAKLMEARSLLLAEQVKYAGEIQAIVPDAVSEYLTEAFASLSNNLRKITAEKAKEEEAKEPGLLDSAIEKITTRFGRKLKRIHGVEVYLPDKKSAERVLYQLLQVSEVDGLFSKGGAFDLTKTSLRNELIRNYGLTGEEADAFIRKVKVPDFRREFTSNLAGAVLGDYLCKGGRLSQDMVVALTTTKWGSELLSKGQQRLKEIRGKVEESYGKGIISRVDELKGKSKEWIRDNWKSVGLGLLIILLLLGLGLGIKAGGVGLPKLG